MPEFKRQKEKTNDADLTKKTVLFGLATCILFVVIFVFGLPFLIRFSVYLAERKKSNNSNKVLVLPPQPPRIIMPFEATRSAQVKVGGYSEKGAQVELTLPDGTKIRKEVDEDGAFVFENVKLEPGSNVLSGVSLFSEDLKSEPSKKIIIIRDETMPELELTNPKEEKITVDVADFDIVGKTEPKSLVTVNDYIASVSESGDFKLKLKLQPGKNEYSVVSKDSAGNQSVKKVTITYDF